jgi:3-hydroxyisobutyrate dehydrogenase-like beta-hydroxyacid dehydrogenase
MPVLLPIWDIIVENFTTPLNPIAWRHIVDDMKIGFIGLGNMGAGMAANLLKSGHEVTAYNRSRDKVAALAKQGAKPAKSVAEACDGDIVITMLADDDAVEAVTFGDGGIIASLRRGATHVSSSTISVALSQRLTAAHADANQDFVAAPVFGRPEAAAAAKLFVIAAGADSALQAVTPVFDAIGQRTFVVAEEPQAANLVKLSGNFLIASVIESLGEAMALVAKAGVDKNEYLEILTSTLFGAPVYKTYGGLIAREEFEPAGFAAELGHKDVRLVLAAGEALQTPLPIASLLRDRFLTLLANGGGDLDWSAVGALSAWEAGGPNPTARD